jgi:molybdopterin converting factor small subunit
LSSPETAGVENTSRRRLLKSALLFAAVGAGVIIGVEGLADGSPSGQAAGRSTDPSSQTSSQGAPLTVKVLYLQMAQTIPVTQESYVLKSPARYSDLLAKVEEEYPIISTMIPTMMVFVNGYPAQPSTALNDGDEVDFVPAFAGG